MPVHPTHGEEIVNFSLPFSSILLIKNRVTEISFKKMTSKAAAALLRLKEIDRKYKSKSLDNNKFSSESSNDYSDSHKALRPRLNIQMPETYVEYLGNYSSSNEQELAPSVKIVSKLVVSSNINSESEEEIKKINTHLVAESKENIEDEIQEPSISELLDESEDFINENSTKEDESLVLTVQSIESKVKTESNESIISKNGHAIETYSKDSFESNSSFDELSQTEETETVKSGASKQLVNNVDASGGSELIGKITSEAAVVSDNSKNNTIIEYDDNNIGNALQSERSRELDEEIENKSSKSDSLFGCQPQETDESLSLIEEMSNSHDSSVQSISSNIPAETNAKTKEKVDNKNQELTDTLYKINDFEVSSKFEKLSNIAEMADSEKIQNEKMDKNKTKEKRSQSQIAENVHWSISRKGTKRKTRKGHQIRMEHKHISSPVMQYLKRLDEENRHSAIFPSRLVFPETVGVTVIRPLELPKISEFIRPRCGTQRTDDPTIAFLQSRLTDIRQWLKDQYILYREHCDLAASINKNYEPVTVENTTKIIHHLREEMKLEKMK